MTNRANVAFDLVCIGARKFREEPETRTAAAMLMVRNAVRVALTEVSEEEVGRAVLDALTEGRGGRS